MKTILITGSTDGIGKLAAIELSKKGHEILVHGRNRQKVDQTVSQLRTETNNEHVKGFVSDLSDFDSIKDLQEEISKTVKHIDVLINNAGVFKSNIQKNSDGLDLRFAVNYFAPVLLTQHLEDLLTQSEASRVINLSSAAQAPVSEKALLGEAAISVHEAYAQSKLALTMWTFGYAKENPKTLTIAVNPGSLLNTRMANEAYGQHWSPASKGSDILCELAISDEYLNSSGQYFDNDKGNPKGSFTQAHPDAYDLEKIDSLRSITNEFLNR